LENVPWIDLARDKDRWKDLVNTVLKIRVPLTGKLLASWGTVSLWRRTLLSWVGWLVS